MQRPYRSHIFRGPSAHWIAVTVPTRLPLAHVWLDSDAITHPVCIARTDAAELIRGLRRDGFERIAA